MVEYEDKESRSRSSSVDAEIFFVLCNDIREMLKDIYTNKVANVRKKFNRICKQIVTMLFVAFQ